MTGRRRGEKPESESGSPAQDQGDFEALGLAPAGDLLQVKCTVCGTVFSVKPDTDVISCVNNNCPRHA